MRSEESVYGDTQRGFSDTTMKLLIDGRDLIKEVEIFLKGYDVQIVYDEETNKSFTQKVVLGEAKVNDKGLQSVMFWIKTKVNPLMSMGNISEEQYQDFLMRTRRNFAANFMNQRINYGISLSNYREIIDYLMEWFEAFFTSPISGGHRRNIMRNSSIETKELVEKEKSKGVMGMF